MPLLYLQQVDAFTKIGVWHITETDIFFLQHVSLQRSITHPHKRLQHLAGRYLLKILFPDFPLPLILIADTRKPFLENEAFHFSISHCGDFAAAIVSTKNRVGADIEIPHNKIEKIKHKFLSAKELDIVCAGDYKNHLMLTTAWSIKEAMFKWYGRGSVNFIKDMQINKITRVHHIFTAHCFFEKEMNAAVEVHSILVGENNLSWLVT